MIQPEKTAQRSNNNGKAVPRQYTTAKSADNGCSESGHVQKNYWDWSVHERFHEERRA